MAAPLNGLVTNQSILMAKVLPGLFVEKLYLMNYLKWDTRLIAGYMEMHV